MLTLKAPRKKMHLKMSSAEVVCCKYCLTLMTNLSIEVNIVDPEQTAPIGSTLFVIETRKADDFCCNWRIKS